MSVSCRIPNRIRHALVALTMVGIGACAGDRPTGPDASILAAKGGGGGGPKVKAADPNSAPQDTTLDIRVIGSGFEDSSVVTLLLAGKSTPKILTNSTTFEDENNLIANVTIALDAEIAFYDIEVAPPRGRPGVGSELFSVKKKGKPGEDEPQFTITTTGLGTLEGRSASVARSIVSAPTVRVVGGSSGSDGAFYWTDGVMVELTGPAEPNASILATEAFDINDGGQIVGRRFANRGDPEVNGYQPLFWSSSQAVAIVLPMGLARSSYATAINNSGQVVGQSFDHSDDPDAAHAMLWAVDGAGNVTTRDLHKEWFGDNGFINSLAEGINDRGQVVGQAFDGTVERAFLWDDGVVTFLDDDVEADFHSFAYAVNNTNPVQIVGGAHDQTGGSRRGLLWTVSDGTVQTEELPVLAGFGPGWPTDLNDRGEAVGDASPLNLQGDNHAILWTFDPQTDERIAVDLGSFGAQAIDNSSQGLTRVVGLTRVTVGKGRKKTTNNHAILWEIVPISQ